MSTNGLSQGRASHLSIKNWSVKAAWVINDSSFLWHRDFITWVSHTQHFTTFCAPWEPRVIAAGAGAARRRVWPLSFVPLDIFRCSRGWPNRLKIHSEPLTTALSELWCYIKRRGSRADFTKATSSPSSQPGTSQLEKMGVWFRAISIFWCNFTFGTAQKINQGSLGELWSLRTCK